MTIKQQGGVFGRNPTFNNLEVEGTGTVDGDLSVGGEVRAENAKYYRSKIANGTSIRMLGIAGNNNTYVGPIDAGPTFVAHDVANTVSASVFYTGGVEGFRLNGTGQIIAPYGVTLGTAAGVYNAANNLDDYEEGTWTPVVSDSSGNDATAQFSGGVYTKIGRMVSVQFYILNINTTGLTAGDAVRVSLPFANISGGFGAGGVYVSAISFTNLPVVNFNTVGGSFINLFEAASGGAGANVIVSALTSAQADIIASFTYNT